MDRRRYDLFALANQLLARYIARHPDLHKQELALALVIQFAADRIPLVGATQGVTLAHVVDLCDELYRKTDTHLVSGYSWPPFQHQPEGVPHPLAINDPRWYKAANGQQGLGCHAQALHFWQNPAFLAEDRDLCPFRVYDGVTSLTLDQGRQKCGFDGNPCGWQPGLPKFLQILGRNTQAQVFRVESTLAMWQALLPEPLPIYPLMMALYFGQTTLQPEVYDLDPEQFRRDFHFSPSLFKQLFTLDPQQPENKELLQRAYLPEQAHPIALPIPPVMVGLPRPTGGHLVLDPEEFPTYTKSGLPAGLSHDPLFAERRRRRQLERTKAHNTVLKNFRRWFRWAGKEVREDPDTFDFLGIDDQLVLLAEIKVLGQQDLAEAIQETLGQLLYFEYFSLTPWRHLGYPVAKAAVFDHPPLGDYVNFFYHHDIHCFWLDEEGRIDGPAHSLLLLEQMGVNIRKDPELMN